MATLDQRKLLTINDLGPPQARKALQFNSLQRQQVGMRYAMLPAWHAVCLQRAWHGDCLHIQKINSKKSKIILALGIIL
jgi:hypothetical protein